MITVRVRLFAGLRERAGVRERALALGDDATAADVWPALELGLEPPGLAVAVNRVYADRTVALRDGDEVALIPPVSGGAGETSARVHVELTAEPIDLGGVVALVADPAAGAIATFLGTVRSSSREREVEHLDYEAYPEMAVQELRSIAGAAAARHGLLAIAVHHRTGLCAIGETTVAIACSSPHRAEAFAACRETIEALKQRVPIWKREQYVDGAAWIGQGS